MSLKESMINYKKYHKNILKKAISSFFDNFNQNKIGLNDAYAITFFVAHSIDYIHAIRNEINKVPKSNHHKKRKDTIKILDEMFLRVSIREIENENGESETNLTINKPFLLIDAINNSLKHIEINKDRHKEITNDYGAFTFENIKEKNNKIIFQSKNDKFYFDYIRITLKPVLIFILNYLTFEDNYCDEVINLESSYEKEENGKMKLSHEYEDELKEWDNIIKIINKKIEVEDSMMVAENENFIFSSCEECYEEMLPIDKMIHMVSQGNIPNRCIYCDEVSEDCFEILDEYELNEYKITSCCKCETYKFNGDFIAYNGSGFNYSNKEIEDCYKEIYPRSHNL